MSFSSEVKEELVKKIAKSRHCQLAELAALMQFTAKVSQDGQTIEFASENPLVQEKCALLLKLAFHIDVAKPLSKEEVRQVLEALKWNQMEAHWSTNGMLLMKSCCKRAFLRGAFLAVGSVSNPNNSYHFELVCQTMEQALQLQELMIEFECDAKTVERKGHYVVYIKEGAQIVDILNVMEAFVSLMNLENVRILKEMRNSLNRKVNCETANLNKTVVAAVSQKNDILLIKDHIGFEQLPDNLREMALVRLEYPEASLKELGALMDPPVGKSGVNHRLRKLSEIAARYREGNL